jgi:Flp pilus assembly protein CpaB
MWKVKRMNTARIVVLTIAVGAGGLAACLASGSDRAPLRAHQSVTLSLRNIADLNATDTRSDDTGLKRGESINVVRYGVSSPTTTQK